MHIGLWVVCRNDIAASMLVILHWSNIPEHLCRIPRGTVQLGKRRSLTLWLNSSKLFLALLEFLNELINLWLRHVWHDDDVSNIFLTCQLPTLDEFIVERTFQDNSGTQFIETARHANRFDLLLQVLCCFHAVPGIVEWRWEKV